MVFVGSSNAACQTDEVASKVVVTTQQACQTDEVACKVVVTTDDKGVQTQAAAKEQLAATQAAAIEQLAWTQAAAAAAMPTGARAAAWREWAAATATSTASSSAHEDAAAAAATATSAASTATSTAIGTKTFINVLPAFQDELDPWDGLEFHDKTPASRPTRAKTLVYRNLYVDYPKKNVYSNRDDEAFVLNRRLPALGFNGPDMPKRPPPLPLPRPHPRGGGLLIHPVWEGSMLVSC